MRKWIRISWRNALLVFSCAVIVLTGSAYAFAQTPFAASLSDDHVIDPGGNKDIDVEPVDNYHFVDRDEYDGVLLQKTEDAGASYINETLFIGDSNTLRMAMFGFLTLDNCIGVESMGIVGAKANKCVYFAGYNDPVTIADALKLMQPRRAIISFGTNDLAGVSLDAYISTYRSFIMRLQEAYPYTDLILSSVPPFSKNLEGRSFTIETVNAYNRALINLAKEMELVFLDTGEAFTGSDGYIKPAYIYSDGIHLTEAGFEAYFKYVRTHSHIVEDTRPKPLDSIPKQRVAPKPDPEKKFDCAAASGAAMSMFLANGFTAATGSTNMTGAVTVQFGVSFAQARAGSEAAIGANLYQFAVNQTGKTAGAVAISYSVDETAKMYNFAVTIAPPAACATHTWGDWVQTKAPTCGEKGSKERTCSVCKQKEPAEIPATGAHTWAPGGDAEGWITDTPATETAPGHRHRDCTTCHHHEEETIPQLPPILPPAP